jgi:hypothetical protein
MNEVEIEQHVSARLGAYTERTDRPPVEGVCECYTDFTGLRMPLRRPCPVHGTEMRPAGHSLGDSEDHDFRSCPCESCEHVRSKAARTSI